MAQYGYSGDIGLEEFGLHNLKNVYWNLPQAILIEEIIKRGEGNIAKSGAVIVNTGKHTGRSPNDKFIVRHASYSDHISWGNINHPLDPDQFEKLLARFRAYYQGRDVFVLDAVAGAHKQYQLPIRLITEYAWANLFGRNLFIRLQPEEIKKHRPQFTILHAPGFPADPKPDGTNTDVVIAVDFDKKLILIGGSGYAGEVKKSIFTILNYLMPNQGVLSMHCSANVGKSGDVALFFGLSGTGKTTLSSDPDRNLIGDDEHGWGSDGLFNFEGGCYARTIRLKQELEPLIWQASQSFGAVLENVVYDPVSREIDFDSDALTENTRAAYPLYFIDNFVSSGQAGHPQNIFFLTADAFGVLPPVSLLTPEQAIYYFLSGYTSKLAGTETGLGIEPQTTFSTCFGAPFLPHLPSVYANLLQKKLKQHKANVWLINTGWSGGPYGVGKRIHLPDTRAIIKAALKPEAGYMQTKKDAAFGLNIPVEFPGVSPDILDPRKTWPDPKQYDEKAKFLISQFVKNFSAYEKSLSKDIADAGPHV